MSYATQSRTAIAGSDYTAVSGTLFFAANETTKTITIPILADAGDGESSEFFVLVLSGPFTTGGSAEAAVTILPELIFRDGFE